MKLAAFKAEFENTELELNNIRAQLAAMERRVSSLKADGQSFRAQINKLVFS